MAIICLSAIGRLISMTRRTRRADERSATLLEIEASFILGHLTFVVALSLCDLDAPLQSLSADNALVDTATLLRPWSLDPSVAVNATN